MAKRQWFGTDGVRGLANDYLTPELALNLAMATASVMKDTDSSSAARPVILIAKDTRQSGDMLEAALTAGFTSLGWDVEILGVVPTPAVAWLVKHRQAKMGVMISASHNAAPDNGIKFFSATGFKLSDQQELEIEAAMQSTQWQRQTGGAIGKVSYLNAEAHAAYVDFLLQSDLPDFKPYKIAVDLANGAMCQLAPETFGKLNLDVHYLHRHPDGMNINDNCGSTHLESLKAYVIEHHCDLGIAFDGDGDRCLAVAPDGSEIDGDKMLYLFSRYLPHLQSQTAVVATVMSNLGLEVALKEIGKKLIRTDVGDRYVLEQMLAENHLLGGEQSGHMILRQFQVTGDGLLTALQLLSAMHYGGKPILELMQAVPHYPQLLKNVVVQAQWHKTWKEHPELTSKIAESEALLAGNGRLLVRASGTEPKLRVMAEGQDASIVNQAVDQLIELIQAQMA